MQRDDRLVWLDLEMTGLDINTCYVLEIAVVVTDHNLEIVAETPSIAIYQDDSILSNMDEWCTKVHRNSGLMKRSRESKITCAQAEEMVLEFLSGLIAPNSSPLCGNSVYQDRKFLHKYMPCLEKYLHYRLFDVSSFRIAKEIWQINPSAVFKQKRAHLALLDARESIEEMKFYRANLLNSL